MSQVLRVSLLPLVGYLVTCIGILVLLISPALAQVNGLGPSPSSSFDTVLNLPGDEASLNGVILQGILGGVTGQTIQLNVSDGGEVGSRFAAFPGLEVNVSGGTVDDIEVNFGAVVNMSGGTVGDEFSARPGSVVNFSGGSISFLRATGDRVVNVFGSEFFLMAWNWIRCNRAKLSPSPIEEMIERSRECWRTGNRLASDSDHFFHLRMIISIQSRR